MSNPEFIAANDAEDGESCLIQGVEKPQQYGKWVRDDAVLLKKYEDIERDVDIVDVTDQQHKRLSDGR